jgi:hypothetical protein
MGRLFDSCCIMDTSAFENLSLRNSDLHSMQLREAGNVGMKHSYLCYVFKSLLSSRPSLFRATMQRPFALVTLSLVPFSFALVTATIRAIITILSVRSATSRWRETGRTGGRTGGVGSWYGGWG